MKLKPSQYAILKSVYSFYLVCKNREPYLDSAELRRNVWEHMKENAMTKHIFIDTINGYLEHCHCLFSFGIDQTISKIMQLLKGESSYWINKSKLSKHKFEWQDEYFGASVSPSMLEKVRVYIRNQEEHHKTNSFQQEFDEFIEKCGFQKFKDSSVKGQRGLG